MVKTQGRLEMSESSDNRLMYIIVHRTQASFLGSMLAL